MTKLTSTKKAAR